MTHLLGPGGPCPADHPHLQGRWRDWRCPLCGSPLRRDLVAERAGPDCPLLHSDDQLACTSVRCHFTAFGNFVAKLAVTRGHTRPCHDCACQGRRAGHTCGGCGGKGYRTCKPAPTSRRKPTAVAVAS